MKILVVEDDRLVAQTLQILLSSHNYAVDIAADGEAGLEMADTFEYDLVLLDVGLPKLDGVSLCQKLRDRGFKTPILLLTGLDGGHQKAIALNAGADDYVVKPFDTEELIARVQALLRRGGSATLPILTWGALSVDPSSRQVTYGTHLLSLTAKEYAILELFLRNPQQVFSPRAILDRVWDSAQSPGEEAVRGHIKELRRKFTRVGAPKDSIETLYQAGYRLNPLYSSVVAAQTQEQTELPIDELSAVKEELRATIEQLRSTQAELAQKDRELEIARQKIEAERQQRQGAELEPGNQWQALFDRALDAIAIADDEGHYVDANRAACELFGVSKAEFLRLRVADFATPDLDVAQIWQQFLQQGQMSAEFRLHRPDGTTRKTEFNAISNFLPGRHLSILRDISDRQQAEAAIRESEQRFRNMADYAPVMVWVTDPTGYCTFLSQSWYDFSGQTEETGLGFGWLEAVHPDDRERARTIFLRANERLKAFQIDYRLRRYDGEYCWAIDAAKPWMGNDGQFQGYIGSVMDISDRQQAEAALRESVGKYRLLFDSIDEGFIICDVIFDESDRPVDIFYVEANAAAVRMTGQELAGRRTTDISPDFESEWFEILGRVARTGEALRMELPAAPLNTWYEFYAFKPKDANKDRVALVYKDVTDRKQAEIELREMSAALSNAVEGISRLDDRGCYISVNEAYARMVGYAPADMVGMNWQTTLHPDDLEAVSAAYQQMLHQGKAEVEARGIRRDGAIFYKQISLIARYDERQQISGHYCFMKDISDRKRLEAELRQSEQKFRAIFDSTFQFIGLLTLKGIVLEANRTALNAIAAQPSDIIGQPIWETPWWNHSTQLQQQLQAAIVRAANGELVRFEAEHILADRTSAFVDFSLKPVFDETGKVIMLIPEGRDITARKQAESALYLSQERLQLAIEGSGDGLWDWNIVTGEVYLSPEWSAMLGYDVGELPGHVSTWERLIHPDDRPWVMERLNAHLKDSASPYSFEYRVQTKSGTWKWIGNHGQVVVRDEQGNPLRMAGLHKDITDRKEAERKIREQAALLDIASDAISVRDLDRTILYWNQGAERLYGWLAEEAIGQKANELLQTDPEQIPEIMHALLERGEWRGELHKVTKAGNKAIVEARWTLVRDETGQPKLILSVDTDITEKKRLEAQFYQAQRLESLGTLAGGIAHDLNNVLTPILTISQLLRLQQPDLNPESQEMLRILEDSTKRGANMVKQILAFTRGTGGERVALPVASVLEEVFKASERTFPKSLVICQDIPAEPLWLVAADPTYLHQVFMNLCVNARDAMPNGGVITLSAENCLVDEVFAQMNLNARVGNHVLITITDTGTGIDPEIRDRIFEPFFTTKERGQGTGLGLSTVYGIVKNYGGFVRVLSEVGKGTQFKVYLPAIEGSVRESDRTEALLLGNGELVLIADDDPAVQRVTQSLLEQYRYTTLLANDGIEAIATYAKHKKQIQVVAIDIMMPNMDGITAIRTMQKMNPQVKIIAMSGLSAQKEAAITAGARIFLSKPYTAQDLLKSLSDLIDDRY
ncbi:MAG: PAS domain S-box protein [Cyanosarcina radialis HA8281-LM2]|jgi:PAS domain S-box-containing protein|nr:PAS domain S-box protein [Cyanosarcina radialis HA8281-LM2]